MSQPEIIASAAKQSLFEASGIASILRACKLLSSIFQREADF